MKLQPHWCNGHNPDGIKQGDRVEVRLDSGAVEWGVVSFCLGSDCCVVPNHYVHDFERSYERRVHVSLVRKLSILEVIADPVDDPSPAFYDYFNGAHRR